MSRLPIRPLSGALLLAAVAFSACDGLFGPGDEPRPPERISELPRTLTTTEQELITASNDFAFHLLRETLAREDEHPNVFLSPLSASMALGMTLNGADGDTFEAMRATLGFAGMSQEGINQAYRDLLDLLLGLDPGVEMLIANSAWAREGWPFLPSFFGAIQEWFDAQAEELDFADPATLDAINGWAEEHTNGRIPHVLDEIAPEHILFLLNAVYFNGNWTHQFDRSATGLGSFTLADGSEVGVERMNGEIPAGVHHLPDGGLVGELPYGGQAFVMNVVLPAPGSTLHELVAGLDASTWNSWTQGFPEDYVDAQEIQVALPKLELSYGKKLNEVLEAMGMGIAFDEALADFSRMIDLPPSMNAYLDFVRQDTFLRVDEEGTEAAAVTTVGVGVTSMPPSIIVDRPYLLVIRERLSGTILFMGAIGDPRDEGG
jgi:serine protease inhibitor